MGYILEPDGENLKLTITAMEGFAVTALNGTITLLGSKEAFYGIGELIMDELEDA